MKPRMSVTKHVGRIFLPAVAVLCMAAPAAGKKPDVSRVTAQGLEWLAARQSRLGHWTATNGQYPTAMTALSGVALLSEGSTTMQGRYAANIRRAVDHLISRCRPNGLIGDPGRDDRYTYGHGFSMLFLSQVLGEEEDADRRAELIDVLTRAAAFSCQAQAASGGWGYVSAQDQPNFDEGSTTITQVQGLRGCRNAGIPVSNEAIEKAIAYIHGCTLEDGGVKYSSTSGGGGRPPITAAAIACLYNAGEYDSEFVPKQLEYCKKQFGSLQDGGGHWHYAHYYYSQVMYREGGKTWEEYRDKIYARLVSEAGPDGSWNQGSVGTVYSTAINLTILQLDNGVLPIYQR